MLSTQYCYKNISFLIFISHKIKIYNDKRKQNPFTGNMTHPREMKRTLKRHLRDWSNEMAYGEE